MRFKVFDMTPEDKLDGVWLNDMRVEYTMEWRQRIVSTNVLPGKLGSFQSARDLEVLQIHAGTAITEADREGIPELLATPQWERPQFAAWGNRWRADGASDSTGRDIFMMVDVEPGSVPPGAWRKGVNRLWVQPGQRRDDYTFDLYMGELEIATSVR